MCISYKTATKPIPKPYRTHDVDKVRKCMQIDRRVMEQGDPAFVDRRTKCAPVPKGFLARFFV